MARKNNIEKGPINEPIDESKDNEQSLEEIINSVNMRPDVVSPIEELKKESELKQEEDKIEAIKEKERVSKEKEERINYAERGKLTKAEMAERDAQAKKYEAPAESLEFETEQEQLDYLQEKATYEDIKKEREYRLKKEAQKEPEIVSEKKEEQKAEALESKQEVIEPEKEPQKPEFGEKKKREIEKGINNALDSLIQYAESMMQVESKSSLQNWAEKLSYYKNLKQEIDLDNLKEAVKKVMKEVNALAELEEQEKNEDKNSSKLQELRIKDIYEKGIILAEKTHDRNFKKEAKDKILEKFKKGEYNSEELINERIKEYEEEFSQGLSVPEDGILTKKYGYTIEESKKFWENLWRGRRLIYKDKWGKVVLETILVDEKGTRGRRKDLKNILAGEIRRELENEYFDKIDQEIYKHEINEFKKLLGEDGQIKESLKEEQLEQDNLSEITKEREEAGRRGLSERLSGDTESGIDLSKEGVNKPKSIIEEVSGKTERKFIDFEKPVAQNEKRKDEELEDVEAIKGIVSKYVEEFNILWEHIPNEVKEQQPDWDDLLHFGSIEKYIDYLRESEEKHNEAIGPRHREYRVAGRVQRLRDRAITLSGGKEKSKKIIIETQKHPQEKPKSKRMSIIEEATGKEPQSEKPEV